MGWTSGSRRGSLIRKRRETLCVLGGGTIESPASFRSRRIVGDHAEIADELYNDDLKTDLSKVWTISPIMLS